MSTNEEIARQLDEIARMMELLGENRFRIAALSRAARVISGLPDDLSLIAEDREKLLAIEGVGKRVADKIQECVRTGSIQERVEYAKKIPPGLIDVLKIPGLGPRTVGSLWRDKGVENLDDLQRIIEDGSILDLPRMGAKSVEKIRRAIEFARASGSRTPIGVALPIAESIAARLRRIAGVDRVEIAGSLRRGRDAVGDIDILACGDDALAISHEFTAMQGVVETLAAGETKSSVRLSLPDQDRPRQIQVDLRVVRADCFGAALLYFTGSKDHNVILRQRAIKKSLTLNEYGLFDESTRPDAPHPPSSGSGDAPRGATPIAAASEEGVYAALDLPFIPPEMREGGEEFACAASAPPRLIELRDIRSDLHAHTTASDGSLSIDELAEKAKKRSFHTIAVTDHSRSQAVAHGLAPDRLRQHINAIREANRRIKGITILAGSEVDILPDGSLDYDDELLAELDIVVASPHFSLSQTPDEATRRLLRAIEHPLVDIIGHPTGRLIARREGLSPDIASLVAAAVEHGTALEINSHPLRLDLRDSHVRAAVEAGVLIAINCDVHAVEDFDNLRFGVLTARRGWLSADRCVNAWTSEKLLAWLKKRRA